MEKSLGLLRGWQDNGAKVIVYPLKSGLVSPGDSILELFSDSLARNHVRLRSNDIVAVSSKIIGISEKRIRNIDSLNPTRKARALARRFSLTAPFAQAVLDESDRVIGGVKGALLTIKDGDAVANAGIDRKNAPEGSLVLWPRNPDLSAKALRDQIKRRLGKSVGVVIVDSRVTPLRLGTTGFAIGSAGFRPIRDIRGSLDLYGRKVEITVSAIADGLATTAQLVMGEASEQKPFAIIREVPVRLENIASVREAKLAWSRCLYMSQITRRGV
jgi:coenzyme F420-0:L-glutamate ligase / coenzyme F420-1:gamma-L-glutamate ligase